MSADSLTLTAASRRIGRPRQMELIRYLIAQEGITVTRVGHRSWIAASDLPRLRAALARWEERPRVVVR